MNNKHQHLPVQGKSGGNYFLGPTIWPRTKSTYDGFQFVSNMMWIQAAYSKGRSYIKQSATPWKIQEDKHVFVAFHCVKEDFCSWIQVDIDGLFRLQVWFWSYRKVASKVELLRIYIVILPRWKVCLGVEETLVEQTSGVSKLKA